MAARNVAKYHGASVPLALKKVLSAVNLYKLKRDSRPRVNIFYSDMREANFLPSIYNKLKL